MNVGSAFEVSRVFLRPGNHLPSGRRGALAPPILRGAETEVGLAEAAHITART